MRLGQAREVLQPTHVVIHDLVREHSRSVIGRSTIDLVMALKGVSNGEAIKRLGETFHLPEKESRISFKGNGTSRFSMSREIVDPKRKRKPTII